MTVLIGLPFHPKKTYAIMHVLEWVERQTYKDVEVVMRWHTGPFGEPDAVKKQREFFRLLAVERGYDYFYSMGTDTIPPIDVIERLLSHKKDVVGALYRQRKDSAPQPIAWRHNEQGKAFMDEPPGLVQVDGMGMDAVLFSRAAFTSASYMGWPYPDDDYPYYNALKAKGFDTYLDTSLVCRHYMEADKWV